MKCTDACSSDFHPLPYFYPADTARRLPVSVSGLLPGTSRSPSIGLAAGQRPAVSAHSRNGTLGPALRSAMSFPVLDTPGHRRISPQCTTPTRCFLSPSRPACAVDWAPTGDPKSYTPSPITGFKSAILPISQHLI